MGASTSSQYDDNNSNKKEDEYNKLKSHAKKYGYNNPEHLRRKIYRYIYIC